MIKGLLKTTLYTLAMFAFSFFVSNFAMAAGQGLAGIVSNGTFKFIITFGFGIFAVIKWIDYFASFSADGGALKNIIAPAVLTFLTFQWDDVLKWFKLV